jgi:hypothetical protein
MLSINLDEESEHYLSDILAAERTTSSELIKRLLRAQWLVLQPSKTFLERRGTPPQHLLDGCSDLSERAIRKQAIAQYLQQRRLSEL